MLYNLQQNKKCHFFSSSDLVNGLVGLMNSNVSSPVNLVSPLHLSCLTLSVLCHIICPQVLYDWQFNLYISNKSYANECFALVGSILFFFKPM